MNSSKSSSNSTSATTNGTRGHQTSGSTGSSGNKNNSSATSNAGSTKLSGMNSNKISGSSNNSSSQNNSSSNNNNTNHLNHNHHSTNSGHHNHGHGPSNASPILPITPSTSVSPPINVICKKENTSGATPFHNSSTGSQGNQNNSSLDGSAAGLPKGYIEAAALHQHQQQQLQHQQQQGLGKDGSQDGLMGPLGMGHNSNLNAYAANLNARLGQSGTAGSGAAGNLTPLGSNSSIMTTPSPPITPQAAHNPLSYVPNHESYNFWHNQYNQYPNNYQTPSSYYTQMDYFNNQTGQANYNMGHGGYTATNFGLTASGAMTAQTFSPNGLDYMSPQDKYVNMV